MTKGFVSCIISESSANAAIAQPVERILGKDEVSSSNLDSSSKRSKTALVLERFLIRGFAGKGAAAIELLSQI